MGHRYYIDCEFLEGTQTKYFLGIPYGKTEKTIDLISIGIVSEDNRKFYAISNEFNLRESWNRYDLKLPEEMGDEPIKVYWIRDNILLPIYTQHISGDMRNHFDFSYSTMKWILKTYGKSNKQIAEEVKEFIFPKYANYDMTNKLAYIPEEIILKNGYWMDKKYLNPEFYVYFGDYDWVVFCWLFEKMINLPNGFPYYAKDLKQIMDEKFRCFSESEIELIKNRKLGINTQKALYPKQTNEHNALSDAIFNKDLHEFLNKI